MRRRLPGNFTQCYEFFYLACTATEITLHYVHSIPEYCGNHLQENPTFFLCLAITRSHSCHMIHNILTPLQTVHRKIILNVDTLMNLSVK